MAWIDYFKTVVEQLTMLISGTTESGSAIPGPPVQIKVGSQAPQLDDTDKLAVSLYGTGSAAGDSAVGVDASNRLRVSLYGYTSAAGDAPCMVTTPADGFTISGGRALIAAAVACAFNGSNYERVRNNLAVSLLASAARTATVSSSDQTNYNHRGVKVFINVTAAVDTPSVVFTIEEKDSVGAGYNSILASAAITGTGLTVLTVYPGAVAVANRVANEPLPRTWRVTATHADTDSITYSVSACTIL